MAGSNPYLRGITLTTANTEYNLFTLLVALESTLPPTAQMIRLQVDPSAGSANVYIGKGGTVSSSDCGVALAAGQVWDLPRVEGNLYVLPNIALKSDTNSTKVFCTVLARY